MMEINLKNLKNILFFKNNENNSKYHISIKISITIVRKDTIIIIHISQQVIIFYFEYYFAIFGWDFESATTKDTTCRLVFLPVARSRAHQETQLFYYSGSCKRNMGLYSLVYLPILYLFEFFNFVWYVGRESRAACSGALCSDCGCCGGRRDFYFCASFWFREHSNVGCSKVSAGWIESLNYLFFLLNSCAIMFCCNQDVYRSLVMYYFFHKFTSQFDAGYSSRCYKRLAGSTRKI